jgi:hypothetical protein
MRLDSGKLGGRSQSCPCQFLDDSDWVFWKPLVFSDCSFYIFNHLAVFDELTRGHWALTMCWGRVNSSTYLDLFSQCFSRFMTLLWSSAALLVCSDTHRRQYQCWIVCCTIFQGVSIEPWGTPITPSLKGKIKWKERLWRHCKTF